MLHSLFVKQADCECATEIALTSYVETPESSLEKNLCFRLHVQAASGSYFKHRTSMGT